jgi:hypothetical protein
MSRVSGLDLERSRTVAASTPVRLSVPVTDAPGRLGQSGLVSRTSEVKTVLEEICDDDHELLIEPVCAIDVAKASGKLCVRLPHRSPPGRRASQVWDVAVTTREATARADQLVGAGIERVTGKSTSYYWRIWYYLLETAGLAVQLVNGAGRQERAGTAEERRN